MKARWHKPSLVTQELRRSTWPLMLLEVLRQFSSEANVYHYNAALASLARSGQSSWRASWEILRRMDDADDAVEGPDIMSFSSSVAAVRNSDSDGNSWTKAMHILSVMSSRGIQTDLICVNSLIAACEKVCRWQSATVVFTESGLSLDSAGYGALISSSKGEVEGVWRVALIWLKLSPANQICYNSCVDACEKGGQWQMSFHLLDRMSDLDEVSFTCRISACHKWEEAAVTLPLMRTLRTLPNLRSYSAAISSEQNWRVAAEYCREMCLHNLKVNELVSNALIRTEKQNWQRATALLSITSSAGLQLSPPGINSCLVCPGWVVTSQLLAQVQNLMIQGNVDSFSALLSAYEKSIMWEDALHVWLGILNKGVRPDVVCVNAMTSAFAQGLCWKFAVDFFGRICCMISADFITRNAILTSCGGVHSWQIALGFFGGSEWSQSQNRELPDMEAHSVMIASCTSSFQWSLGLRLLERMDANVDHFQPLAVAISSSLRGCLGDYADASKSSNDASKSQSTGDSGSTGSLQRVPHLFSYLGDSATLACAALCSGRWQKLHMVLSIGFFQVLSVYRLLSLLLEMQEAGPRPRASNFDPCFKRRPWL
eukprot:s1267_g38.t2